MSIEINIERDQELMQILGINELSYSIVHTDKGELTLTLLSGEDSYKFFLDNEPVGDELNYSLMKFFE